MAAEKGYGILAMDRSGTAPSTILNLLKIK